MILEQRNKLIHDGKALITKGIFPDEVLGKIKDGRLRNDVARKILSPSDVKFHELTEEDKLKRKALLDIKLLFDEFMSSLVIFNNISYTLILLGFFTFFSRNSINGFTTVIIGIIFLVLSIQKSFLIKSLKSISFVYIIAFPVELFFLGYDIQTSNNFDTNVLQSRRGALVKVAVLIIPLIYPTIRIILCIFLFLILKKQKHFFDAKKNYETPTTI